MRPQQELRHPRASNSAEFLDTLTAGRTQFPPASAGRTAADMTDMDEVPSIESHQIAPSARSSTARSSSGA